MKERGKESEGRRHKTAAAKIGANDEGRAGDRLVGL